MKKYIAGIIGIFFFTMALTDGESTADQTYRELDLLAKVLELVKDTYVEDVSEQELLESAIRGMLSDLDPHSGYMDARVFRENQIQTRGEYGGVGIEVLRRQNALQIIAPMDDTPGSRAGLQAGDFITHIDGKPISEMENGEAVNTLRGKAGSPVDVTIVRPKADRPFDVTLVREVITLSSVRHRIEDGNIGYLRLTTFNNENTSSDLEDAIDKIQEEAGDELVGYVLDLRNNPGGLLDQAIEVSDLFLEQGEIVSIKGRHRNENARWNAGGGDVSDGLPIVVLVNAGTASASEIVAGALQDHKRATILGVQSFGKGVVQTVFPLTDERAVRITTARYYTPAGRSIQALGIEPDILVEQPILDEEGRAALTRREADLSGHIPNENGGVASEVETKTTELIERPEPQVNEDGELEDYQLNYAIGLLTGALEIAQKEAQLQENSEG